MSRYDGGNKSDGFKEYRGVSPRALRYDCVQTGADVSSGSLPRGVTHPSESLIKDTEVLSPENCGYTPDFAWSFEVKKSVCKKGDTVLRTMGLCNSPNS